MIQIQFKYNTNIASMQRKCRLCTAQSFESSTVRMISSAIIMAMLTVRALKKYKKIDTNTNTKTCGIALLEVWRV